jgi:hypothetical protein
MSEGGWVRGVTAVTLRVPGVLGLKASACPTPFPV